MNKHFRCHTHSTCRLKIGTKRKNYVDRCSDRVWTSVSRIKTCLQLKSKNILPVYIALITIYTASHKGKRIYLEHLAETYLLLDLTAIIFGNLLLGEDSVVLD